MHNFVLQFCLLPTWCLITFLLCAIIQGGSLEYKMSATTLQSCSLKMILCLHGWGHSSIACLVYVIKPTRNTTTVPSLELEGLSDLRGENREKTVLG